MHTVSTYPMKDEDANLNMIKTLRDKFNCDVGYSGHEVGLAVSYAAAALGITSLERHITLDRAMYGSDQSASVEPSRTVCDRSCWEGSGIATFVAQNRKCNGRW